MTDDLEYQLEFVMANAWRLLGIQDRNPLSPTHGCFHYAYWRDKTSEFADARMQEAGAALGLLSLPCFDRWRADAEGGAEIGAVSGVGLASTEVLYEAFRAGLLNLSRQQYADGCYDEWYKGERGFAATEFTTIAYGLAAHFLKDRLRPAERELLTRTLRRAGEWLARRHDRVKANHEAAAAAALALVWEVTGESRFREAAARAMADTLSRQTGEAWFPEVGGMDLGYCSVLLDYTMLYVHVTGDQGPVAAMRRLLAFMWPNIHPDATVAAEAGLCLNPYVSRLGVGLLSPWDDGAAALIGHLRRVSPGRAGVSPYLADDLRLSRWSYLPVVTILFREVFRFADAALPDFVHSYPRGWSRFPKASVMAWHDGERHLYFAPCGGGVVRAYVGSRCLYEDLGFSLISPEGAWGSLGYDPEREVEELPGGYGMRGSLGRAAFFFPGFWSRLVLRIGCTVPLFSYWLRAGIDFYRQRRRTAVNQSAAPVAGRGGRWSLRRQVVVDPEGFSVHDVIEDAESRLESRHLLAPVMVEGRRRESLEGDFSGVRRLSVVKELAWSGSGESLRVTVTRDP
ncbi:MAG: hypothetical protein HQL57_07815 [Magnetococcales bacterium]|nr:hypothetical protein [Magnetococcales bacterium]